MNANLQKYLKYKSKYLDLKNELMGGKNYAELNGGGDIEDLNYYKEELVRAQKRQNLRRNSDDYNKDEINIEQIKTQIKNLELKLATENADADDKLVQSAALGRFKGMTQGRVLEQHNPRPGSLPISSKRLGAQNAFGPLGQFDDAPEASLRFDPIRGESPLRSMWDRAKNTVGKALSPRKAISPSKDDSSLRAATGVRRRSPGGSQQQASSGIRSTGQRDDRTAITLGQSSLGELQPQTLQRSQYQSRERKQEPSHLLYQDDYDPNVAGSRIGSRSRSPELDQESKRILEVHKQNKQKLLDKINKRSGVDSRSQMLQSVTQVTNMLEKDFHEIENEIKQEDWFSGLKLINNKNYENHLDSLKMFINKQRKNAYINIDKFFKLIDFLKEQYKNNNEIISFLNTIKK
jgi:hypothetical protein